jgi:hypothetical protein
MALSRLEIGFQLDHLWHHMKGEMEPSKRPALLALAKVLAEAAVPYAIIGGVALQVHQAEPRTTLDIDLVVRDFAQIPRAALEASGFAETGRFEHSHNWLSAEGTPVQFTADPLLLDAIERAEEVLLDGVALRVLGRGDLLRAKLRAGSDPARRRSKRLQDLADVQALLEADPTLDRLLSSEERSRLQGLLP